MRTMLVLGALATIASTAPAANDRTPPQAARSGAPQTTMTLEGPYTHENLALYVVMGTAVDNREYITLNAGLTSGLVAVREKGARGGQDQAEVNTLEIENRSSKWLFLQAGDIVKGGKQDRTIYTDLVLAPQSKPQPIEAFCVERGRWNAGRDGLVFASSPAMVSGTALKKAIQGEKNQGRVWQEVARAEERTVKAVRASGQPAPAEPRLSSTGTYNAIVEHEAVKDTSAAYVAALLPQIQRHKNAVGLAVAINGSVAAVETYVSPSLFQKVSEKLLSSYALEAFLAREGARAANASSKDDVQRFVADAASAAPATESVGTTMRRSTRETQGAVLYEYEYVSAADGKRAEPLHRSFLKK